MGENIPAGYRQLKFPSGSAVAHSAVADDVAAALHSGAETLHEYARTRPDGMVFRGRNDAIAFEAPLSGEHVIVRRTTHGGVLAPLTGQLFAGNGRAPQELRASFMLRERGIATPEVLAYAVYPAAIFLSRIDVMLRFIPDAQDLASFLAPHPAGSPEASALRVAALKATAELMRDLANARIRHPDLNLRNVLVGNAHGVMKAWVLDIDRVSIDAVSSTEVARANVTRFMRSARKLQRLGSLSISEEELAIL